MEIQSVGSLQEHPFARLLLWVVQNSFSGVLVLARDEIKKSFVFERGKIISARSNIPSELLGAVLLDQKKITPENLEKSREEMNTKGVLRQGEMLISMGFLDQASLADALESQLVLRVNEVFTWENGRYGYVERVPEDTSRVNINKTVVEICFRGLIQKYRSARETTSLDLRLKPILVGGQKWDISQLKLMGREMSLYRAINGINSIEEIIGASRIEADWAKAILLACRDMGLVRLGGQAIPTFERAKVKVPPKRQSSDPAIVTEMDNMLVLFQAQNHFEILGISQSAAVNDVKAAYFGLAKKYHPDRAPADISPGGRKTWEDVFAFISEAHAVLTNDAKRKEYMATLEVAKTGMVASEDAQKILQSEMNFQKANILVKKGDFPGAVDLLSEAVRLYAKEAEYFMLLGWAMFKKGSKSNDMKDIRRGKEHIEKAVSDNPTLSQGYYYLGLIAKGNDDLEKAMRNFAKTLDLAPNHNEASSELRIMNMRKTKLETGGLKGLFRKKEE